MILSDVSIKRPVFATVISLLIVVFSSRSHSIMRLSPYLAPTQHRRMTYAS